MIRCCAENARQVREACSTKSEACEKHSPGLTGLSHLLQIESAALGRGRRTFHKSARFSLSEPVWGQIGLSRQATRGTCARPFPGRWAAPAAQRPKRRSRRVSRLARAGRMWQECLGGGGQAVEPVAYGIPRLWRERPKISIDLAQVVRAAAQPTNPYASIYTCILYK